MYGSFAIICEWAINPTILWLVLYAVFIVFLAHFLFCSVLVGKRNHFNVLYMYSTLYIVQAYDNDKIERLACTFICLRFKCISLSNREIENKHKMSNSTRQKQGPRTAYKCLYNYSSEKLVKFDRISWKPVRVNYVISNNRLEAIY